MSSSNANKRSLTPNPSWHSSKLSTPPHQTPSSQRQPDLEVLSQTDEEVMCSRFNLVPIGKMTMVDSVMYSVFYKTVTESNEDMKTLLASSGLDPNVCHVTFSDLYEAWRDKNFTNLKDIINSRQRYNYVKPDGPSRLSVCTRLAWNQDFVGDAHSLLRTTIQTMLLEASHLDGNFCHIIQGTGTGKSRLVDKLAESVFTIPVVLRNTRDTSGYPFADAEVVRHLEAEPDETTGAAIWKYVSFILNILKEAHAWIVNWKRMHPTDNADTISKHWRTYLEEDGRKNRKTFFSEVVNRPPYQTDVFREPRKVVEEAADLVDGILLLLGKDQSGEDPFVLFSFDESQNIIKGKKIEEFDSSKPPQSPYQCLCKAFRYFTGTRLFVLFLSTCWERLDNFSGPPTTRFFWSFQGEEKSFHPLNPPFVELPFDIWENSVLAEEDKHTIEEVCSLKFMSRFGRPLFWTRLKYDLFPETVMSLAMENLVFRVPIRDEAMRIRMRTESIWDNEDILHLLPSLALRVGLTFDLNQDDAKFLENLLVEKHMRTIYSIPEHCQYLCGGYPSEPFLAEAAARTIFEHWSRWSQRTSETIEKYKRNVPMLFSNWLKAGLITKGRRGELIARILLTLAHDLYIISNLPDPTTRNIYPRYTQFSAKIPVVDFLRSLISATHIDSILNAKPQNMEGPGKKTLEEAFAGAFVHFTQFVSADDMSIVTDEACMWALVRGAIIQGHDNLDDIDIVLPICMEDGTLNRWIMSAIFIQIRDPVRKQLVHIDVESERFDFFSRSEEHPDALKRPYITIAMDLGVRDPSARKASASTKGKKPDVHASSSSYVDVMETETECNQPAPSTKNTNTHPRYEVKLIGCSPKIYNVVADRHKYEYDTLLAPTDLLSTHPKRDPADLKSVLRMQPFLRQGPATYNWGRAAEPSRVGAVYSNHAVVDVHVEEDEEEQLEGVKIRQFGDAESDSESD